MVATIITDADRDSAQSAPGYIRRLVFTVQPVGGVSGQVIGQPTVACLDYAGNVDTGFAGNVNLAISNGVMSGVFSRPAVAGIAAFSGISVVGVGPMQMMADATGAMNATSDTITMTAA